jgi:hypothetical protein
MLEEDPCPPYRAWLPRTFIYMLKARLPHHDPHDLPQMNNCLPVLLSTGFGSFIWFILPE